jgi:hypothetical protein
MGTPVPQTSMPPHPWRALARLLLPFRVRLTSGILISVLQCATALPMGWLIRRIFDRTDATSPSFSLRSLQPPPAILVITHVPAVLALADEAWTLNHGTLTRNPEPVR